MMNRRLGWMMLAVGMIAAWAETAHAAMIINFGQNGSDAVAVALGSLNINASGATTNNRPLINPQSFLDLGAAGVNYSQTFTSITGPRYLGTGVSNSIPSSASGSVVGFSLGDGIVFLPAAYVAGSSLLAVDTFAGQTIASLGLATGTYTYAVGYGASADTIVVNIGTGPISIPSAVPEPASACLMGLGLAGVGVAGWKRSRRS